MSVKTICAGCKNFYLTEKSCSCSLDLLTWELSPTVLMWDGEVNERRLVPVSKVKWPIECGLFVVQEAKDA